MTPDQEIWMNILKSWRLPESECLIKIRKRAGYFYELWLPDLCRHASPVKKGAAIELTTHISEMTPAAQGSG